MFVRVLDRELAEASLALLLLVASGVALVWPGGAHPYRTIEPQTGDGLTSFFF
jgi:hypothetical protein